MGQKQHSVRAPTWRLFGTLVVALLCARGCGDYVGNDSSLVGGPCRDDHDCDERCVEGKDYPDGTCTVGCGHDHDCPDGTSCVDKAGGVCLLACGHDADCRGGYDCHDVHRKGGGGEVAVCIH